MLAWFCSGSILTGMAAPGAPAHRATSWPVREREMICQPAVGDIESETLQCTALPPTQWPVHLDTKLMVHKPVVSQTQHHPCHTEKKQYTNSTGYEPVQLFTFPMILALMTNMIIPDSQQNKVYIWLAHIRASRAHQGWISYFSVITRFGSSNLDSQRGYCPLYWKFSGAESTVRSFLNTQGVDWSFPDHSEWKVTKNGTSGFSSS